MIVAIASGKGGTGKTTLSVNLARSLKEPVLLVDCDVEEPNAHLFIDGHLTDSRCFTTPVPAIDNDLCNGCGKCKNFCEFNALAIVNSSVLVFPELCHGCGGCRLVCPNGAITETDKEIGKIERFEAGSLTLVHGRLKVGVPTAPPLIRGLKKLVAGEVLTILDSPPGTSCPVVTTIQNSDFVVLVTEPTPFGLNDLEIALDLVTEIGIPHGVVINRSGNGNQSIHEVCRARNVPVLLEIPDDRRIAETYSKGQLVIEEMPEYSDIFRQLLKIIKNISENNLRKNNRRNQGENLTCKNL